MTHQQQHTSTSPIAAAHTSLYTWYPPTQQAISFLPAISSEPGAISTINAHHTRLVKLFSFKFGKNILHKYFFDENLLDKKEWITVVSTELYAQYQ